MKKNVIILFVVLLGLAWFVSLSETVNNPREVQKHLQRAEELEEKGIYVDAISEYKSALEYEPDNQEIYLKMAEAELNSGDSREFVSICEETAEEYQNTEALDMLMDYYVKNDYEDRAVKYLKDFTEEYPDNKKAEEWFLDLKGTFTELYCRYDAMNEIVNDTMPVQQGKLYGIADADGQEIISAEYKQIYPFSEEGLALAEETQGKWVYIDEDGQTRKVPDEEYKDLGMFSSGHAVAKKMENMGILTRIWSRQESLTGTN